MNTIQLFFANLLNRGIDAILADLTRLDAQLDAFIARQQAVVDKQDTRIEKAKTVCEKRIDKAQAEFRGTLADASVKAGQAERDAKRAVRVAGRLKALTE
jgi:hypothetical protein